MAASGPEVRPRGRAPTGTLPVVRPKWYAHPPTVAAGEHSENGAASGPEVRPRGRALTGRRRFGPEVRPRGRAPTGTLPVVRPKWYAHPPTVAAGDHSGNGAAIWPEPEPEPGCF